LGLRPLYLPLLPLVRDPLALRGRSPGIYNLYTTDEFAYYSVFVLAGFALATQPALKEQRLRRNVRA
jgi:hypothetical protein